MKRLLTPVNRFCAKEWKSIACEFCSDYWGSPPLPVLLGVQVFVGRLPELGAWAEASCCGAGWGNRELCMMWASSISSNRSYKGTIFFIFMQWRWSMPLLLCIWKEKGHSVAQQGEKWLLIIVCQFDVSTRLTVGFCEANIWLNSKYQCVIRKSDTPTLFNCSCCRQCSRDDRCAFYLRCRMCESNMSRWARRVYCWRKVRPVLAMAHTRASVTASKRCSNLERLCSSSLPSVELRHMSGNTQKHAGHLHHNVNNNSSVRLFFFCFSNILPLSPGLETWVATQERDKDFFTHPF